ncbi:MAG: holo-ACP synthase [Holosporales bacterium]|jgi:holo-[acyl-carrier protein] synthase|nr:holo-ACP synthase [Holosporales bacterium]
MILGLGVDIVDINRIERLANRFPERFRSKLFTGREVEFCDRRKEAVASFAKIFAIKEATVKAISDIHGIGWKDVEVTHDSNGKPLVNLFGNALENSMKKVDGFSILASVSDEKNYAVALVVIESI